MRITKKQALAYIARCAIRDCVCQNTRDFRKRLQHGSPALEAYSKQGWSRLSCSIVSVPESPEDLLVRRKAYYTPEERAERFADFLKTLDGELNDE